MAIYAVYNPLAQAVAGRAHAYAPFTLTDPVDLDADEVTTLVSVGLTLSPSMNAPRTGDFLLTTAGNHQTILGGALQTAVPVRLTDEAVGALRSQGAVASALTPLGPTSITIDPSAPAGTVVASITGLAPGERAVGVASMNRIAASADGTSLIIQAPLVRSGSCVVVTNFDRALFVAVSAGVASSGALTALVLAPNLPSASHAWMVSVYGRTAGSVLSATSDDGTVLSVTDTSGIVAPTVSGTFALDRAGSTVTITITETLGTAVRRSAFATPVGPPLGTPLLLESFDDPSVLTPHSQSAQLIEADLQQVDQGTGRTSIGGVGVQTAPIVVRSAAVVADPSQFDLLVWSIRVADQARAAGMASNVQLGRGGAFSSVVNGTALTPPPKRGRFVESVAVSELTGVPTGVGSVDLQFRPPMPAPYVSKYSYDALYANAPRKAAFVLTFDDGKLGQYVTAFPYLRDRGMKATVYVPSVGTTPGGDAGIGRPGNTTWAMLREMEAAGWDMAQDVLPDDGLATSVTSTAQLQQLMQTQRATILANGISDRCLMHGCWSVDAWQCDGAVFMATGTVTTNSSAAVTLSAAPTKTQDGTNGARSTGATAVGVGYSVYGWNVPAGTTVVSVTDATHLTLSAAVPIGTTSLKFVDEGDQYYGTVLSDALAAIGFVSMRSTEGTGTGFYTRFGLGDQAMRFPGQGLTGASLATVQSYVDAAIRRGNTLPIYTHDVGPGYTGINLDSTVFTGMIDYVYAQARAGLIDVLGISEWWARDGAATFPH